MNRNWKIILAIVAGFLFLCLLCVGSSWLGRLYLRARLRDTAPLVSILSPHEGQAFSAGDLVIVHATARELNGLERIELWVDGALVADERIPSEASSTILVLHESLSSLTTGAHEIIVRAWSTFGASGQGATWFEVLGGAASAGSDVAGSGMGPTELASTGRAEPDPGAAEPGSTAHMMDWLSLPSLFRSLERVAEPIFLQLEIIALRTDQEYEGLHCYLGAADVPPRWFPDVDFDQSTDESFISLGDGFWDIGSVLSGESAPYFLWQSNEPIPLDITCVGLTGGGTDALELGSIVTSIEPEAWDGIVRRLTSTTIEGSFDLDLRIAPLDEAPSWHLLELDRDMSFPTNLRMGFYTLHWDYEPEPDEAAIDGFRIRLNGDVLWIEPPSARESYLPYEWLSPPCGRTYSFTVDAIRGDDWSIPSNPVIIEGGAEGSDECNRTLILTFENLETFQLPEDEGHDGWVGPLSGSFYAGEQEIRFDSSCPRGGYCDYIGIGDDESVSISYLTSYWGPGPARFVLHVPPGEDMVIGFEIRDHDAGGGSQVLCENWRLLEDRHLDSAIEASIGDYLDHCKVTFSIHPALGSVVSDPDGPYPLPQLGVTDLSVNDATGQLRVHVRNFGRATWPSQDLEVAVVHRDGSMVQTYTFEDPVIRPGETDVLTHPDLVLGDEPLLNYCVVLDPNNRVPEYVDQTDVWSREPFCRALPDLTITDVLIDEMERRILTTVRNIGDGSLFHRSIPICIRFYDGGAPFDCVDHDDVSLDPWESRVLFWEGVSLETLARLQSQASVLVDDLNHIAESNEDNNTFDLPAGGQFRLIWQHTYASYVLFADGYGKHINEDRFFVEVHADAGGSSRHIVDWEIPQRGEDCDVRADEGSGEGTFCDAEHRQQEFELHGDEALVIDLRGELTVGPYETGLGFCIWDCEHSLGRGELVIDPDEWFAAPICAVTGESLRFRMRMQSPDLLQGTWFAEFDLCRVGD